VINVIELFIELHLRKNKEGIMENAVTIKLEDYDNMIERLRCLEELRDGVYKSITRYTKEENGNVVEQSLFTSNNYTIRITIDKEKLLIALGFNTDTIIEFK
jgi:hypothetical protein